MQTAQPWHCQHDSAPHQTSRPRRAPQSFPSVASKRPGHWFPVQEQRSQGPHSQRLTEAKSCRVQGGPEILEGIGSSTEVPGSHQPDGAETERPVGKSTFPERDSREADWLPSQLHTHFQGSWTGPFQPTGSGQEGILGSWGDTGEACNKGAPQNPGFTLRL